MLKDDILFSMSKPIMLCIGAAVQDVFMSNSDAFEPVCLDPERCFAQLEMGAKADVNKIDFKTGGGATNAATTFARQGMEAIFIGQISNDPAGMAVMDDLDKESIDTQHMVYSKKYNTGYSVILLASSGERTILTYRGASTHYSLVKFKSVEKLKPDWLFLSTLGGNFELLEYLLQWATTNGIKVAFNPGKKELAKAQRLADLLPSIDILSVNKEEAQIFVDGETSEELARELSRSVEYVLISDGPRGSVATNGKSLVIAGMYEDVPVLDRTGAGDAFTSGFVSQIALGKSLKQAITFASANSTSVVTQIGAKTGILEAGVKLKDMELKTKKL